MQDAAGDRALNILPQIRLNFIDGYVLSYCSVINFPERLEQIRQTKKLVSVLCYLGYDCMRGK